NGHWTRDGMRWTRERRARQSLVRGEAGSRAGLARKRNPSGAQDDRRYKTIVVDLRGLCTRSREDHWRPWLADDEVVWSWRLARGVELAQVGNVLRRRRWQAKSDHRGEHEVSVKTIAQGKPGVSSVSASACARTFFFVGSL